MKVRHIARAGLTLLLLLLVAESGLALTTQPNRPSETANASADSVANAPWFNTEVDTSTHTGQHTAVAIQPLFGRIFVSHYSPTYKDLLMAQYPVPTTVSGNCGPNSTWHCQFIDTEGDVGKYSSITTFKAATYIAYQDSGSGDLKWAVSASGPEYSIWDTRLIDIGIHPASTGHYVSAAQGSSGYDRIVSYQLDDPNNVDALRIARYVGGSGNCGYGPSAEDWQCDTIHTGEGVGQGTSLALDATGDAHIAYYDAGNGDLWYATNSSANNCGPNNTWTCYQVSTSNDVGRYASMYVDSANNFHIAYYDATVDVLKYAHKVSGGGNCGVWNSARCDTIDAMPADNPPDRRVGISIAEDAAGYPIIAYQSANDSLNVARPVAALGLPIEYGNCGPVSYLYHTWYCETIHRSGKYVTYRNGDFVSIATNSVGLATIAYYEYITGSGGKLGVSRQLRQVFMPSVVKDP